MSNWNTLGLIIAVALPLAVIIATLLWPEPTNHNHTDDDL